MYGMLLTGDMRMIFFRYLDQCRTKGGIIQRYGR